MTDPKGVQQAELRTVLPVFEEAAASETVERIVDCGFDAAREEAGVNLTALLAAGAVLMAPALRAENRADLVNLVNQILNANAVDFELVPTARTRH